MLRASARRAAVLDGSRSQVLCVPGRTLVDVQYVSLRRGCSTPRCAGRAPARCCCEDVARLTQHFRPAGVVVVCGLLYRVQRGVAPRAWRRLMAEHDIARAVSGAGLRASPTAWDKAGADAGQQADQVVGDLYKANALALVR